MNWAVVLLALLDLAKLLVSYASARLSEEDTRRIADAYRNWASDLVAADDARRAVRDGRVRPPGSDPWNRDNAPGGG